ncbi:MAG: hypothetical protein IT458_05025 [Planctomycetes bacterium]|nr:hypothetical protein [Planctomycetota bacterium]
MVLASLSELKEHEGISGSALDAFFTSLLARVSAMVDRYCNRTIEAPVGDVTEYYDGSGCPDLFVLRYPIVSVTSVHVDAARAWGAATLIASSSYATDAAGRIRLLPSASVPDLGVRGVFPEGVQNVRVVYVGGYTTVPEDLKEAAILWCSAIFAKRRKLGVLSTSIGAYSVTYGQASVTAPMPAEVRMVLDRYRRPPMVFASS